MKRWRWPAWTVLGILLVAAVVRFVTIIRPGVLWWDETIYLGMGKYLFSGGVLGYWEMFRPPVFPVIMGLGWWVGLPIIVWGKIVEFVAALGVVYLTYRLGERLHEYAGLVAAAMVAIAPVFISFGNKLLTGSLSTGFVLLGVWLLMQKRWYWSGLLLGIAFLTRFIHNLTVLAIAAGVVLAWLLSGWRQGFGVFVRKSVLLLAGFFTTFLPYAIFSFIRYQNPLGPLIEGSRVFTQYNNFVYDFGNWFYVAGIFKQNPLFFLAILGVVLFMVWRRYRDERWNSIVFPAVALLAYFLIVAHKEVRFLIPALPFLAILAGVAIVWLLSLAKNKYVIVGGVAGVIIFSLLFSGVGVALLGPNDTLTGDRAAYYTYFSGASMQDKMLIASNPLFMVYTDKPITFLRSWELSGEVMRRYGNQSDFVAADLCDYPCDPTDATCAQDREDFVLSMDASHERIFNGSYVRWDGVTCGLVIWSMS